MTKQVKDGQIVRITHRVMSLECCDCGLVHIFRFRVVKGKIQFRVWQDAKGTKKARNAAMTKEEC